MSRKRKIMRTGAMSSFLTYLRALADLEDIRRELRFTPQAVANDLIILANADSRKDNYNKAKDLFMNKKEMMLKL